MSIYCTSNSANCAVQKRKHIPNTKSLLLVNQCIIYSPYVHILSLHNRKNHVRKVICLVILCRSIAQDSANCAVQKRKHIPNTKPLLLVNQCIIYSPYVHILRLHNRKNHVRKVICLVILCRSIAQDSANCAVQKRKHIPNTKSLLLVNQCIIYSPYVHILRLHNRKNQVREVICLVILCRSIAQVTLQIVPCKKGSIYQTPNLSFWSTSVSYILHTYIYYVCITGKIMSVK